MSKMAPRTRLVFFLLFWFAIETAAHSHSSQHVEHTPEGDQHHHASHEHSHDHQHHEHGEDHEDKHFGNIKETTTESAHDHSHSHSHSHAHSHNHNHERRRPRVGGMTPLMGAVLHGELDRVEQLLNDPAVDISATNDDGVSALMFSFGRREYKISEILLKHGADVHAQNSDGVNALMLAISTVKDEDTREALVSMLVERGATLTELGKRNTDAKEYLDKLKLKQAGTNEL